MNRHNVQVQFWHVPKKQIEMADYLAGCRLEGFKADDSVHPCLEMSGGDKADDGDEDEEDEAERGQRTSRARMTMAKVIRTVLRTSNEG